MSTKTEILLEVGTNELEVLEFIIADNSFGINVAKIKELMQYRPVQPLPRSHQFIEGIFQPRQEVYTVVDLGGYLFLPPSKNPEKDIFIITSFNQMNIAFRVHGVESIHRISWAAIEKPDATIYGGGEGIVTGIAKVKERIIAIVDFEKIIFDISPESGIQISEIDAMGERTRNDTHVLIAEDSELLRRLLHESVVKAGYTNVVIANNGQEAWDILNERNLQNPNTEEHFSCIITDIEMPQMDGHRFTKLVKSDPKLKHIPVIIFSSLIDETMQLKGREVGADAQLSKPEIGNLGTLMDKFTQVAK